MNDLYKNLSLEILTCPHEGVFYTEEWKDIVGYEGLYQISNFGRVKSLPKSVRCRNFIMNRKERILLQSNDKRGYLRLSLATAKSRKSFRIHVLVWDAFGTSKRNGRVIQVDHKDNDKKNNSIFNLQTLSNRNNCIKKHRGKYMTGVSKNTINIKESYYATIQIKGKTKYLGSFSSEIEAHNAYLKAKSCL